MVINEQSRNASKLMYIFAIPRLGCNLLLGIVTVATFNLYTYGYELGEFWVGTALALGYFSIALSQFFFGWISDKWYTRWGRRKPWILILAPISVISFIALLVPGLFLTNPSKSLLLVWLIVWDVLFEMAYAVTTPYSAWMAELFTLEERPKTSQIQNIFNVLGTAINAIFIFFIFTNFTNELKANPGALPSKYPIYVQLCFIFSVIFIATFYLSIFLMPTEAPPKNPPNLINNLKNIRHNRNYLFVVLLQGMASLAWITVTAVLLNYTQYVLSFGSLQYMIAGATLALGIFIFLYIWRKIIVNKGKKQGLLILFIAAASILSCSLFGLVPFLSSFAFGLLFTAGIAFSLGGWYLISGIWYADLAEDDAKRTDDIKAGLYVGFPSIVLNIFQAIGMFILGIITSLPNITVGTLSFSLGYVLWGPISAVFLILTFFYAKRFIKLDFEWAKTPLQATPLE